MTRRHDVDALRVIAFTLLIAYHIGMLYVSEWDFHVKSTYQREWLQWPMIAINRWRMPLLFMISGIALAFARTTRSRQSLAMSRSWRLLLPLAFGMLAIVPVQAYCEARSNGAVPPGFAAFLFRYLQLRPWPEGGWTGAEHGVTWNHLWYLAYAWLYTMLVLGASRLVGTAMVARLGTWVCSLHPAWILLGPTAWLFACLWWLMPRFPETHALTGDWYAHAKYFAFFLAGWLVARQPRFWNRVRKARGRLLVMALASITVELALRAAGRGALSPGDIPAWALHVDWAMIERIARASYSWTALLAIFGWAHALLNRPFRWLPRANEAVYPCYILHQSLIVVLGFMLSPLLLGPWLEPLLVATGTLAGCLLLHECLIRRTPWLRPLFGLPPMQRMPGNNGASLAQQPSGQPDVRN